ncbi:testis-expressed protein 11 [Bufo gargarizans]|uniref:testis-expressed protein 11 n=1 Tax=Bufo gargarizans TaxID=30331 RepID=UPI001CF47FB3|nr:testis-expressed protein 11 [Bufo gargarizans]
MEPPFDISNLIEQMYKEIKSLEVTVNQGNLDIQTEECAINLWNWGVTKKSEDSITKKEQAMVRHISCRLGYWCQGLEPSEEIVERNILMAMKTGKGWIDAGTPETGTEFLEIALNNLEKLYSMMTQRGTQETDVNLHKAYVERDIFKVLTYQVEAAVYLENFELASRLIQRCKDMLQRQPNKASYLSILCYNFGVEMYEKKFFDQSSFWLSQSYEIGKTDERYKTGHEMQAKVLRLLATVYLEWDCRIHNDKALNAIRLANEEHLHPSGLFLKMKILLHCSLPDDVISMATVEMLCHELSLDIYLNTVKLLMKHNRNSVGFDFLKMVCNHFEQSPDIGKALLLQIEILLKKGKEFLARQKVEDLITGHYTGKQLPVDMLNHLHLILWDCATKSFESKNYSEALQWYNYSLSFYAANHNDPNLAKLQRNRASCFLYLNEPLKAKEAVIAAEKCEKGSIFTQFISYKIAIKENDVLEATNAISAMGNMANQTDMDMLLEENCSAIDLLSLAAQIALDANKKNVSIKALECVVEHCEDPDKLFTPLRGSDLVRTDNNPLAHLDTAKLGALEQRWAAHLTTRGLQYCLVMIDHFSKFAVVTPTQDQMAESAARAVCQDFIQVYGCPKRIHSDQGACFQGKVIEELQQLYGIEKSRKTPYQLQGNGACERFNRTTIQMLRTLEKDKKTHWPDYLPELVWIYNNQVHTTTGYTPYMLLFGRVGWEIVELNLEQPGDLVERSTTSWVKEHRQRLQTIRWLAELIIPDEIDSEDWWTVHNTEESSPAAAAAGHRLLWSMEKVVSQGAEGRFPLFTVISVLLFIRSKDVRYALVSTATRDWEDLAAAYSLGAVSVLRVHGNCAYKKLKDPLIWKERHEQRITEAQWFRKIAWNLAVQTEDSPLMMKDCFLLSYKISLHCPCDRTVLVAQKSCLLMAASVDLEMARNATCHSEQVQLLTKSLENIKLCREVWIILQSTGTVFYNPTEIILLLFEFEVRAKLNDPGLETVLESVWNLSSLDTKTLESIASLSMEAPAYYPSICKKVLLAALNLYKKHDSLNVYRISKCLHSLIKLTLPERPVELENCDKKEAWQYYQEALTIISTYENYPGAEILWLMTHAWNTGIYQYGEGKYSDAARWCSLALSFLSYLGSLKGSYESKVCGQIKGSRL